MRVQEWHRRFAAVAGAVGSAALLSGCSTMQAVNPVNWWHSMEGGKIAEQRPPPPGTNDAYPNLASVPAKPAPPDKAAMEKLTNALIADRTNVQHTNEGAPLPDPSLASASPGLFGVGTLPPPPPAPPPGQAAASASFPASSAPPPPPAPASAAPASTASASTPAPSPASSGPARPASETAPAPSKAPVKPVQSTPLESPPQVVAPAATGAVPALPTAPPGAPAMASTALPPPPAPAAAASGPAESVAFAGGSAALSPAALKEVKAFAAKRGGGTIAVTGFGDAASSDPAAQSAAVSLGLSRAQAVANALSAAGVPPDAVRVNAEAAGRGASLRLLQ